MRDQTLTGCDFDARLRFHAMRSVVAKVDGSLVESINRADIAQTKPIQVMTKLCGALAAETLLYREKVAVT